MGIISGIISFAFGLCINLLDSILQIALDMFSFDFSVLYQAFPFARHSYDIFVAMGLCFLIAGVIWQTLKGFTALLGTETENPLALFFKVALTWFAVVNSMQIVDYVTGFFRIALQGVQDIPFDSAGSTTGIIRMMTNSILSSISGITAIVMLILLIILGFKFLKFWLEIIERYIVYCFICFVSPIFIATAAFKSTRNIAETWMRSFFGQSLIIVLNAWCCRMFMSFCAEFSQSNFTDTASGWAAGDGAALGHFTLFFLGMAFLNFAMRIDTYLRILGLNTAQSGGALGRSLGSGAMMAITTAKNVASSFGGKSSTSANNTTRNNASGFGSGAAGASGAGGTPGGIFSGLFGGTNGNGSTSSSAHVSSSGGADSVGGMSGGSSAAASAARYGDLTNSGASMQPNARILQGESLLENVAGKQGAATKENGVGGTSKFQSPLDKQDFMVGGMESTRGYQQQFAQQNIGNSNPAGSSLVQDQMTSEAARSIATSAEFARGADGSINPVAEQGGASAGTLMNGVLAFDNQNLGGLVTSPDGNMAGMQYKDGSTAMFDYVGGGIAEGVYTAPDGSKSAFSLVHDNAVETNNILAGAGEPGYSAFDASGSIGRVGDGSGKSGYHVIPRSPDETARPGNIPSTNPTDPARYTNGNSAQTADNLHRFVENSNPVSHQSRTLKRSQIEQMRDKARGSTPNPNWWGTNNIPKG